MGPWTTEQQFGIQLALGPVVVFEWPLCRILAKGNACAAKDRSPPLLDFRLPCNEWRLSGRGRALVNDQFAGAKRTIYVHATAGPGKSQFPTCFRFSKHVRTPKALPNQGVRLNLLPYAHIEVRGWGIMPEFFYPVQVR
jgi:hypothetical protein